MNSILSMNIKETNDNILPQKESKEDININLNEEINKLQKLDNIISNCIKSITLINNKDFLEIINDYIQKYIFGFKQNIYNSFHLFKVNYLSANKQTLNTSLQITHNISFEIINESILKIIYDENNLLKQNIKSLSKNSIKT